MSKCDIIIPIYNAYDCVVKCLDSIIKNTDMKKYHIICINDASPDEKIKPMLKEYDKKYSFITYLDNKENLGFVGTVNRGMKYSKSDVILLNSDTEVTPNWLDRIVETAYKESGIATVTPLSNNATLVSAPIGLQPNDLPTNVTLDEYGKIVDDCAYNENIELPTAHGFCMFIKRSVLNEIGYFDEETFGKGYGEETDFSFRCLDYGYKNVLCDSVIIYHKEKQSFSSAREKLAAEHEEIINKRYPEYNHRIHLWCQNFPLHHINTNISYNTNLYNRKNILLILHDWNADASNAGGTSLHVLDIIKNLREDFNFHILTFSCGVYKLFSYFKDSENVLDLGTFESSGKLTRYNKEYKNMLNKVVKAFGIDFIHVHHMINHYFDIIDVIKENKLKSAISLHDLYSLCPTINMLYMREEFCLNTKRDCKKCLKDRFNLNNDIISSWRKEWNSYLKGFDNVFVPSNNTKELMEKFYKDIDFTVIEHGVELDRLYKNEKQPKEKFNIAFVGVCAPHKGGNVFADLVKNNKNKNIKYHLFGLNQVPVLEKNKKLINHGPYRRVELPKLLTENKIDLVCLISLCPETFSYTLTEVASAGIPVITFNIGAIADRVKKDNLGYIIDTTNNYLNLQKEIDKIIGNLQEYNSKIKSVNEYKIKTDTEMVSDYKKYYKIKLIEPNKELLRQIIKDHFKKNFSSFNSDDYYRIINSYKWRLVSKIKTPEFIRKIARKILR